MAERAWRSVTLGLAILPPIVIFAMNSFAWGSDLDAIALAYRVAIYLGLLMALASIALAIRQMRKGSYTLSGLSLLIALAFIVWVGPDAYLDLAAAIAGP